MPARLAPGSGMSLTQEKTQAMPLSIKSQDEDSEIETEKRGRENDAALNSLKEIASLNKDAKKSLHRLKEKADSTLMSLPE